MADDKKRLLDSIKLIQQQNEELTKQKNSISSIWDMDKRRAIESEILANNQLLNTQRLHLESEIKQKNITLTKRQQEKLNEILGNQQKINDQLTKENNIRKRNAILLNNFTNQIKIGWKYLQETDKIIRQTTLNLGMSGAKAEMMRASFEQSAVDVARMGGSLADVQGIMQGYADETGRARALTASMVTDIVAIGRGTGIGIEAAAKLGGQFELMGFDARRTVEYIQGVVDTSELMGVNTQKVLKNVSDNFKKLQTMTFQQGVKGYAQMAMYAEKMKIDMNDALGTVSTANNLEKAVDLAAQLQVMGGEFAKTDPFQLLFLSRNDPAKFTEKINDMTKGVVSFRKMADGSFEKFISPADRDRLEAVGAALGKQTGEMTAQALRMADIQRMRQQMVGTGLSPKDKEIIEGMGFFNAKLGTFQVKVGEQVKNLSNLTDSDAKLLQKQSVALKQRAEDSLTFEESFKATIAELKSALLPILRGVNAVLIKIKPIVQGFTDFFTKGAGAWAKTLGLLVVGGGLLKAASMWISKSLNNLTGTGAFSKIGKGGAAGDMIYNKGGGLNVGASRARFAGKTGLAKAQGAKNLKSGLGAGAAGLGIGAGVGIAAAGIGELAESMKDLSPAQIKEMNKSLIILGATMTALGIIGMFAAPGMWAVGGAVALIGVGIGAAAAGIGFMATGLGKMLTASKGAGKNMGEIAVGIGAISLATSVGGLGLLAFTGTLSRIGKHAPAMAMIGDSFKEINATMSGSKDDFIAIENAVKSISSMNTKGGGMLTELANLLKKPLKVEFTSGKANFVSEVVLNMDGKKIFAENFSAQVSSQRNQEAKNQGWHS